MGNAIEKKGDELLLGHYKHVHIASFVQDIILEGESRIVEVCKHHGVDDTMFTEIIALPSFIKEMREVRALSEASPNAMIQLKARLMVERGLNELQRIVKTGSDKDKIKAMEFLAKISGTMVTGSLGGSDEGKPQASGLVLNVNLGSHGLVPPLPAEQRPLRTVKQVQEIIEVKPVKK